MATLLAVHKIPSRAVAAGLYIHIPFCHAKCNFCDFATFVGQESKIEAYLQALSKEMTFYKGTQVSTLFFGGGTPTVLTAAQIDQLFSSIRDNFDLSHLTEATIEANPESSTYETLSAFYRNGINRISFGLQTTQPKLLSALGRQHTLRDFAWAYLTAREIGFENINVDLMFGLPGQTEKDWEETLNKVIQFSPEHISAYALKVEEGTKFKKQEIDPDQDIEADLYLMASRMLSEAGYDHYEISNFAKPGFESLHNLKYWKNQPTLGLGVSSTSYLEGKRFKNTPNLTQYLNSLSANEKAIIENSELDEELSENENVMLALRLKEGLPSEHLPPLQSPIFDQFIKQGYARLDQGHYRLTPEGWLLSNQLFQHLV